MLPDRGDVDELIARAEAGDVAGARNGLREYTRRHPNMLLAWKWLADIADSPKERADCVRRAQLLAPGDPWLVEAKKQRLPPGVPRRAPGAELPTRPYPSPLAPAPAAPPLSFMRHEAAPAAQRPDDLMPATTPGAWPHVPAAAPAAQRPDDLMPTRTLGAWPHVAGAAPAVQRPDDLMPTRTLGAWPHVAAATPAVQRPDDLMPTRTLGAWPHVAAAAPAGAAPPPAAAAPVLVPLIDDLNEELDEPPAALVAAPPLLAPPLLAPAAAVENGFADYPGSGLGGWLLGVAIGLAALGGLLIGLAWFINGG